MIRFAQLVLLVFVAWWVINDPVSAGHAVHHLGGLLNSAATSLKTALSSA
jgi:hypothetical protein